MHPQILAPKGAATHPSGVVAGCHYTDSLGLMVMASGLLVLIVLALSHLVVRHDFLSAKFFVSKYILPLCESVELLLTASYFGL